MTNVELDHHSEFRSLAELEAEFDRWAATAPHASCGTRRRSRATLALPGEHNRLNAGAALAALELAGVDARGRRRRRSARFTGTGPAVRGLARSGGVTIVDDYAHHPAEIEATIAAAREAFPGRRLRVLFQPHLVSRTRHLAGELGAALAAADDIVVTDVYLAREAADPGRHRQARRRRALRSAAGSSPGSRRVEDGGRVPRAAGAAGRRAARARRRRASTRAPALIRDAARRAGAVVIALEEAVALSRLHDDRHRRAGALARAARDDRGARRGARLGGASDGVAGRGDRARLEPARRTTTGVDALVAPARRRARRGARSRASCSSRAAVRRTPSACIARATPGSAGSSSPRRSRARPAAACG